MDKQRNEEVVLSLAEALKVLETLRNWDKYGRVVAPLSTKDQLDDNSGCINILEERKGK